MTSEIPHSIGREKILQYLYPDNSLTCAVVSETKSLSVKLCPTLRAFCRRSRRCPAARCRLDSRLRAEDRRDDLHELSTV